MIKVRFSTGSRLEKKVRMMNVERNSAVDFFGDSLRSLTVFAVYNGLSLATLQSMHRRVT